MPDSSCRKVTPSCAPSPGSLTLHLQLRWSLPPGADWLPRRGALLQQAQVGADPAADPAVEPVAGADGRADRGDGHGICQRVDPVDEEPVLMGRLRGNPPAAR